uniref:Leucine-rich repeat G protein-coupled receptor 1 n=1 Tax=Chilo suppressalis TaxID=168631 RepID=A0A0S1YDB2_CHISP|nr:leucine-rich repeat G protein-coupled receptor 1 [Chilo suppressalis]
MYFWKQNILAVCIFLLVRRSSCDEVQGKSAGGMAELINTNITVLSARSIHMAGYHLHEIQHLTIINAPRLNHIVVEDLTKMPKLKSFYISQAPMLERIAPLPPLPLLRTFIVITSGLVEVPNLSHVHDSKRDKTPYLQVIDLEGNHIRRIPAHALRISADHVSLNLNLIEEVPAYAFKNAVISKLSFKGNTKLSQLDENAFAGILLLRQLDLSSTAISTLPIVGLENLQVLKIEKTPTLKYIPSIYDLRQLKEARLTHHFHCCAFAFPERHDPERHKIYEVQIAHLKQNCGKQKTSDTRKKRSLGAIKKTVKDDKWDYDDNSTSATNEEYGFKGDPDMFDSDSSEDDDQFHDLVEANSTKPQFSYNCEALIISKRTVECTPKPNALNPCEDVMGWTWLRVSVWLGGAGAVVGNLAVLIVLLAATSELTVPRFLMCHLAFSDLCTGLYLFMLAVVDLRYYGVFFNYAYDWQYGVGCKIAGFLSVFSGQLSVFTLSVVTSERWFAITYAIYLERRMSLSAAAKIMIGGWLFSVVMAGLPLAGVSDYSSTSICLPVESRNVGEGVYQGSLFLTNAVAWLTIVVCYVQIYRSLGGGGEKYGGRGAAAAAERRIANKMAMLIGTNLLCWAPVAFFGVTALAGAPLVDVSHGKVLLVFFYPLNAVANPFLYAILTKQYRRDFMMLIARTGKFNWLVEKYKLATTPPPTAHTNPSANPATLVPLVEYNRTQSQVSKENGDALF